MDHNLSVVKIQVRYSKNAINFRSNNVDGWNCNWLNPLKRKMSIDITLLKVIMGIFQSFFFLLSQEDLLIHFLGIFTLILMNVYILWSIKFKNSLKCFYCDEGFLIKHLLKADDDDKFSIIAFQMIVIKYFSWEFNSVTNESLVDFSSNCMSL